MSFLMGVKIFADLCLYCGVVSGAAPWFGGMDLFLLWPALLCAAGVWLAALGEKWPVLRFVGLLPPLASLLLANSLLEYILLIPALIYTILILLTGRFDLSREAYHDFFFRSLLVAGALTLLVMSYPTSDWKTMLFFLSLYLLLGVYMMRQLRLDRSDWGVRGLNLLSLFAAIACGGVLCLLAWLVLQLCGPVWDVISGILVQILSGIVYAVVFLSKLFPSLGVRGPEDFEMPNMGSGDDPVSEKLQEFENPVTDQVLTIIGIVLAVLIVAVVIWRMLGTTRKRKTVAQRISRTESIDVPRETGPSLFASNRDKIRRSYRKFMQLLLDRGAVVKPSDTTLEIQSTAHFLQNTTPAHELRQLYLTARYDEEAEVTNQQVRDAKELVRTIRKDPEIFS